MSSGASFHTVKHVNISKQIHIHIRFSKELCFIKWILQNALFSNVLSSVKDMSITFSGLICMKVAQLYLTLWDPMSCSLPGCSVHGILQARILE